ncbi:nuclease-related domain-containing protein [Paenarthrobacter sp. NPDC089675]|uniref:nuclease-related domain-containing protein n=1 Tax=Paenarthrobacter TaxID=1742992 RepID=UPI0037F6FB7A
MPGQGVIEHLLALQRQQRPRPFIHKIFGVDPLPAGSHSWYKGALGEIAIGYLLTALGPDWTVLHAVPVGAETTDIDHVLIGPSGVFTINTKNHSGQSVWVAGHVMMVAGRKQRHLHNARYEATRAANLLGRQVRATVPVTAVIVIRNPKSLTIRDQPIGAAVLTEQQLIPWLKSRPVILNPKQVELLVAAAEKPNTWHRHPQQATDPVLVRNRFSDLQKSINRSRAIRGAWVLGLLFTVPILMLARLTGY